APPARFPSPTIGALARFPSPSTRSTTPRPTQTSGPRGFARRSPSQAVEVCEERSEQRRLGNQRVVLWLGFPRKAPAARGHAQHKQADQEDSHGVLPPRQSRCARNGPTRKVSESDDWCFGSVSLAKHPQHEATPNTNKRPKRIRTAFTLPGRRGVRG